MRYLLIVCLLTLVVGCEENPFGSMEATYKQVPGPAPTPTPTPTPTPIPIDNDKDDDGVASDKDCDDHSKNVGTARLWYADDDNDDFGTTKDTSKSCKQPDGYVDNSEDCNDGKSSVNPDANEVCDGADNDCNGQTDDATGKLWYHDGDGDGHGDSKEEFVDGCSGANFLVTTKDDCNDDSASAYPGAKELCDKIDNNCDGKIDVDAFDAVTWYLDNDGDGYGNSKWSLAKQSCNETEDGYVLNNGDCRDDVFTTHPGAEELCDGWDNNCSGDADEGALLPFFPDTDGDLYGDSAAAPVFACVAPANYAKSGDCNDKQKSVYPFSPETCDGLDNNCDGKVDEAEPNVNLCEDGDPLTTESCGGGGCVYKDVQFLFACELPKKFADAGGYFCGSAVFFDDFTDADGYGSLLMFDDGTLSVAATDVCAELQAGHTMYVNSYVAENLGGDAAYEWVGGYYATVSDSLTGEELSGKPGLVTVLAPGLDFNYVLADVPLCQ